MGARMRGQVALSGAKRFDGIATRRTSRATLLAVAEPEAESAVPIVPVLALAPVLVRCRLLTRRIGTTRVTFTPGLAVASAVNCVGCVLGLVVEAAGEREAEAEARLASEASPVGPDLRLRVRACVCFEVTVTNSSSSIVMEAAGLSTTGTAVSSSGTRSGTWSSVSIF